MPLGSSLARDEDVGDDDQGQVRSMGRIEASFPDAGSFDAVGFELPANLFERPYVPTAGGVVVDPEFGSDLVMSNAGEVEFEHPRIMKGQASDNGLQLRRPFAMGDDLADRRVRDGEIVDGVRVFEVTPELAVTLGQGFAGDAGDVRAQARRAAEALGLGNGVEQDPLREIFDLLRG